MKKPDFILTPNENSIMEILWDEKRPMTSVELATYSQKFGWKSSYIHIMIRSLLKKKMIQSCGTVQYGTQYARQFTPIVSKEAYAARLALSLSFEEKDIPKVALALVREAETEFPQ